MSIFVAIIGLAFLILVHEAGHFYTARLVNMRPRRFYLGFPPAVIKKKRNGIEYGVGAIPLGGYVKIPGMHRPAAGDVDMYFGRALERSPELVGPVQRLKRALDDENEESAEAALDELTRVGGGEESLQRGLQEISDGLAPDAYWRQPTWKRVLVIVAGPATNLILAVVLFACLFLVGGGKATTTVDSVLPKRPAAAIGLKPGDQIIAVNNVVVTAPDIAQNIAQSRGKPLTLFVTRGDRQITLGPAAPEKIDGAYRLGFVLRGARLGVGESAWQSVKLTGTVTREIGKSLGGLVHGKGRKEVSSPVGITQTLGRSASQGLQQYLWVLALISLSLALMNMLPFLPLDGGHIAFSLIEGIRGRAVAREVYERVSVVGIVLVALLFFIGISNDIGRLGGS